MKKILAALLAAYALQTNGQTPPISPAPGTTTTTAPGTTRLSTTAAATTRAQTTAAATTRAQTTTAPVPVTPAPVTPAPVTAAPVTAAPTTAAPTTAAPVPAPTDPVVVLPAITPSPVTPTPTVYVNPFCPVGSGVGRPSGPGSQDQACATNVGLFSVANDYQGRLRCDNFACCQCSQINCGFMGWPCDQVQIGDSGAVGVQSINIQGGMEGLGFGNQNGAKLECNGLESCKAANIHANYLRHASCSGDFGCQNANLLLENPAFQMGLQCSGLMSCLKANIEIAVGVAPPEGQVCSATYTPRVIELGQIEFNGQETAREAYVHINNKGCDQVLIPKIECMNPSACVGITFVFSGQVTVVECDLQGIQNIAALPVELQLCALGGNMPFVPGAQLPSPFNQFPSTPQFPATPQLPAQPVPAPVNPVPAPAPIPPFTVPVPSPPAAIPQQPVFVTPAPTLLPPGYTSQLNCNPAALCAGRTLQFSPRNNFVLDCSSIQGCQALTLTLDVGLDPITYLPVEQIDSLKFVAINSGLGATITINNVLGTAFGAAGVQVGDIRCEEAGACNGLTINAGYGIVLPAFADCQKPNSCTGCTMCEYTGQCRPCEQQYIPQVYNPQFPITQPIAPIAAPVNQWW